MLAARSSLRYTRRATHGYGLVNARLALTADVPKVSENPLGELTGDAGSGSAGKAVAAPLR